MNCETFRDRCFDYLDGSLADRGDFEAHRASCASCGALLAGIEHDGRLLRGARVPTAPTDLWVRIASSLSEGRALRRPRFAALATAAAAILAVAALIFSGRPSEPSPKLDVVFQDVEETADGYARLVPSWHGMNGVTALAPSPVRMDDF